MFVYLKYVGSIKEFTFIEPVTGNLISNNLLDIENGKKID